MPRLAKRAEAKFFFEYFIIYFTIFLFIFPKFSMRRAETGSEISARAVKMPKNNDLKPETIQI